MQDNSSRYVMLIWILLVASLGYCADQPVLTVGILPTFNSGGDNFGSVFDQHLALTLFQQLQGDPMHVLLMNPGGRYIPTDDDWLLDYGKHGAVDYLVITTLLKTYIPEKGNCNISVQTELLDLRSGVRSGPWKSMVEINKHDIQLDYGALHMNPAGSYYMGSSRLFEKQPLGKAMKVMAEQVRAQVLQAINPNGVALAGKQSLDTFSGPCDLHLKVLYTSRHAASKSYTIFVNNEDETLTVKDGVLLLRQKSGPLLLQWMLNDAPYKLPKQELYQAATNVNCSKPEQQLNINIGPAGEALLNWQ